MYTPDISEIPESDQNWKAPEETNPNLKGPARKKIEYSLDLGFRSADGNFDILQSPDRLLTGEDIAKGFLSRQDKRNSSFAKLLEGLPLQLHDPTRDMSPERRTVVESLKARKPTFIGLDKAKVDHKFVQAAGQFPDSRPGVILFPETGEVMNQFSAIEYSDGRMARLMGAGKKDNLDDFVHQASFLTPNIEAHPLDDKTDTYAMEFVQEAERPQSVTQTEIDDWLARVKESGLIFGFDVSEKDIGLDNFVRKDGKLFWVDGNILKAEPAAREEDLNAFIETQRRTLGAFTKQQ